MDRSEYYQRINLNPVKLPDSFYTFKDKQIFGNVNDCKYGVQMGHLSCRCSNDSSPVYHCPFNWYTGGIIPDKYCRYYQSNPKYIEVSPSFFTNRKQTVKGLIKEGKLPEFEVDTILKANNLNEYIHKPYNAFIIGMKGFDEEFLKSEYGFLFKYTKTVNVYGIDLDADYESQFKEMMSPNLEFFPCIFLKYKDTPIEKVNEAELIIRELLKVKYTSNYTRLSFIKTILRNELLNLAYFDRSLKSFQLDGMCEGKPIVCVSGGPTVNDYIPVLKKIQGKVVIIAVISILRTLLNNGIKPDIVTTLDMDDMGCRYIEGIPKKDIDDIYFCFDVNTSSKLVDMASNKKILHVSSSIPGDFYNTLMPEEKLIFRKNGSVAMLTYRIAAFMKPSKIYLIGFDLCMLGNQSHADGCAFSIDFNIKEDANKYWLHNVDENTYEEVYKKKCYNGDDTYVTTAYYSYQLNLEGMVKESCIPTFCLGERASKKDGIIPVTDKDLESELKYKNKNYFDLSILETYKVKHKTIREHINSVMSSEIFFNLYSYELYIMHVMFQMDEARFTNEQVENIRKSIKKQTHKFNDLLKEYDKHRIEVLKKY